MENNRQALDFLEGAIPVEEEQPDFLKEAIPYEREKREITPEARKRAREFKFLGYEPSPEAVENLRRKAGILLKEYAAGTLGLPGDVLRFLQRITGREEVPEVLPTGETVRGIFEKLAGEEFRPETTAERFLERGAGLLGALTSPIGPAVGLGRAAAAAGLGAGAETLAEQLEAPTALQTAAGIAGSLIPFLTRRGVPPTTRAAEIARREAIEAPAVAVAERVPRRRLAIARPTRLTEKRRIAFEKSVERAKDRILESVTPLAKTEGEAALLKKESSRLFERAERIADKIKVPVSTYNLESAINKNIARIERSPALATAEKSTLNFLERLKTGLEVKNTPANLMALNKSLNKEIEFLKPTAGDKILLDIKNALAKDMEEVGKYYPSFKKAWTKANAGWTEFSKSMEIRNVLEPIFTEKNIEFKKFEKLFTDPKKRNQLTKLFGKTEYQRLKDISQLSARSSEVFKELTKDPTFIRQIERWSNYGILGSLLTGRFGYLPIVIAEKTALKLMRGYYGRLFTDPKYQRHYSNLLKSLKKGNIRGILITGKKVNDDIETTKKDIQD